LQDFLGVKLFPEAFSLREEVGHDGTTVFKLLGQVFNIVVYLILTSLAVEFIVYDSEVLLLSRTYDSIKVAAVDASLHLFAIVDDRSHDGDVTA